MVAAKRRFCSTSSTDTPCSLAPRRISPICCTMTGKALGRLVAQQHARAGAQDPGEREHLLFTAGELAAGEAAAPASTGKAS